MTISSEVQEMYCVAKGAGVARHENAAIPEEGKWIHAKEIKDISGFTHGIGWCAPQQGACKLSLNIKQGIIHIVPVAMIHAANPLRFFVLLAGGCMVMVGALPIHEDEDGIGGDLYNLFSIGTILFTQALVALSTPLLMLAWLPSAVYWGVCIYRAKDWPSWRLWIGITAYAALAMEFLL